MIINTPAPLPKLYPGGAPGETVNFSEINQNQAVNFTLLAESEYHAVTIRVQCACTPTFTVNDAPGWAAGGTSEFSVASAPGQIIIDASASASGGLRKLNKIGPTTNVLTMDTPTNGPLGPILYGSGAPGETVNFSLIDPTQPASFKLRAESLYHAVIIDVRCPCTGNGNRNRRN